MQRSKKVNAIYAELRQALGDLASPAEIFEFATELIEIAGADSTEPRFDLRVGVPQFEDWPVDSALADGGWRLMGLLPRHDLGYEELDRFERDHLLQSIGLNSCNDRASI